MHVPEFLISFRYPSSEFLHYILESAETSAQTADAEAFGYTLVKNKILYSLLKKKPYLQALCVWAQVLTNNADQLVIYARLID